MFMSAEEFPLPYEYRFLQLDGLVTVPPEDLDERTMVFLDCGNIDRNPADVLKRDGRAHPQHRPPPRQHAVRDGQPRRPEASCTAEIVWHLHAGRSRRATVTIAEALYVGLVTDTGKFMYENTAPARPRMAAELIAAGVDAHEIYRRLYEGIPFGKLELLARGLANVERYDGGA